MGKMPMLLSIACVCRYASGQIIESPRLKTRLPNGSAIIVQRMPDAKTLSVQLFASAKGLAETPETHGRRHLLEHILAKGYQKDLDKKLETRGAFLTAYTARDWTKFQIDCEPQALQHVLEAVKEFLKSPPITQAEIQKESLVLQQEWSLQDDNTKLWSAAWAHAHGELGLDPFGSNSSVISTKPEELLELHREHFSSGRLVLSIAGPISLDSTMDQAKLVLGEARQGKVPVSQAFSTPMIGKVTARGVRGEARAVPMAGLKENQVMAALAVAMVLQDRDKDIRIHFSPSASNNLIVISSWKKGTLKAWFDEDKLDELIWQSALGISLVRNWFLAQRSSPARHANFQGVLWIQDPSLTLEKLLEAIAQVSAKDFEEACARYRTGQAVLVEGVN